METGEEKGVKSGLGKRKNELTRENCSVAIWCLGTIAWFWVFFLPSPTIQPETENADSWI